MLLDRIIFRYFCIKDNRKRKKLFRIPDDIERKVNLAYGKYGKWNLLDVYFPKGTGKALPTIINIHGGGYVYGTKEEDKFYCMNLAQHGFTVINFTYRLAPRIKFPVPVIETNEVMKWVCSNAADYFIDVNNIFFTGDSAGAQIASQYSAIVANPEYAGLFDLSVPPFKLRAIALNCGMYDVFQKIDVPLLPGLICDYCGKDPRKHGEKINLFKYINKNYPPAFIMSAANDFLLPCARPMFEHLQEKGIESVCEIFGTEDQKDIGHVFHLNILSPVAKECNDRECEFFRGFVR
jgi:acetyl esterase/lipase